jgi:type II secretory pathway pseudopilin PulG
LLREFTFGHARQLESVLREHLVALCGRVELLPDAAEQRVFIDIDSLLRPVYGHAKQGASSGHTKIAGKQILRKGLSPLATTISTAGAAPVIAGMRLRAGRTGSAKGAGRMIAQAISTARAAGASAQILVRGDSAYGNRAVVRTCLRAGAQFSLVMIRNPAVERALATIDENSWNPVSYPGAVRDPDTGAWISDAEVAEIPYTAFASTRDRITARLVVRRVKDARFPDALFPIWRYHPFLRGDRPQPATGCRCACRRPSHSSALLDAAAPDHQHSRPDGQTPTPPDSAPTQPLALVEDLACTVAQHHRTQPTTTGNPLTICRTGRPERTGKAGQTSRYVMPTA